MLEGKDRTYKELVDQRVKVGDMSAGEFAMFNRVNGRIDPPKERGSWGTLTKGLRGIGRGIADNFVAAADDTEVHDRSARKEDIIQELADLEQAHDAHKINDRRYNLEKATLEIKLDDLN